MDRPVILSLGSVNVDVQVRADEWPSPGATRLARDFRLLGGGKAANVALVARRLGVPAQLFARVGDDEHAALATEPLARAGVDLGGVRRVVGVPTGLSIIVVPDDGRKGILLATNANDAWTEDDAASVEAAVHAALDGSVLVADVEIPAFVVRRALRAARDRGFMAVLDPSFADRVDDELVGLAHALTPDASEAESLTGIAVDSLDAALRAGERLRERGARLVFAKVPGGGCAVVGDGVHEHVEARPVAVVDTTGAGDAFAGALGVALLEGRSPREAARLAAAAATAAVTRYGSQPAYPTREELERFAA